MTLSFSTKWPERMGELAGQPNCFVEKILCAAEEHKILNSFELWDSLDEYYCIATREAKSIQDVRPKLHTIRHDPHNRWRSGTKIHPVINNRTKNRFQFAPVMECVSVQEIEIEHWNKCSDFPNIIIDKHYEYHAYEKDGYSFMEQLALNDGFPSVEAFFDWFNEDTKPGTKIIHWTDLKY